MCLAQPYDEGGQRADPDSLMGRVEEYPAEVPYGGLYITAGVDMQLDRLECGVVAWGLGEESWSLGYHVLWGDPLTPDPWEQLDDIIAGESTCTKPGNISPYRLSVWTPAQAA